ncbi:aminopeptidase [Olsenella massiliensis]|uniref:aminopeptidase n=1 Tax=Olsenella massiliensis TaxID=1622075 RepID=UPI00071D3F2D|nr:aminopeptidase [Olsenella massiliensis]
MSELEAIPGPSGEALATQKRRYARLLVRTGVAIKKGQELVLQAPVERADFARMVVGEAYAAGAARVTVLWRDDQVDLLDYQHVALERFMHTAGWKREQLDSLAEAGAAFLFLTGSDPSLLADVDPAKPAAAIKARNTECRAYREGMDFGRNAWCIAGVPVEAWARRVFGQLAPHEAVDRLWRTILVVARSDGDDPESAWASHDATLNDRKRLLSEAAFTSLRYLSSNGTDLTVGLNPDHVWEGGSMSTQAGRTFFPNMPTEEVFTTPDRLRAEGVVHSALPLVHAGQVVDDFWLRFSEGRVVEFDAARGKDVLEQVLATDEGARRLGECALISKDTPIRQSGLLFYNTLYDENASCHLALGMGFPECLRGGSSLGTDDLLRRGVNQSATHVDFMMGADDLAVWGVDATGAQTPLFERGRWATSWAG